MRKREGTAAHQDWQSRWASLIAPYRNQVRCRPESLSPEERVRAEEELPTRSHGLGERVKELNSLYGISSLLATERISLEEILSETAKLIPPAWQYPEVTCARITLEGREFRSTEFEETAWKLARDIVTHGQKVGTVEVYYLEERPESHEGPFLKQEGDLLNAIAERLGRIIKRKRTERRIEHLNAVLHAIRNVNQLIVRENDPNRLLQKVCNSLIETRGYYSAWFALFDEAGGLATAARAGLSENFVPLLDQLRRGELPDCARRALTQKDVVVIGDPFSTCTPCPLAHTYSGRAAFTVRLEHRGKTYGLLAASFPRDFIADEEERSLFSEVAGDIAFALYGIETRKERERAEEALKESEERYRSITEALTDYIYTVRLEDGRPVETVHSPTCVGVTGYTAEEFATDPYLWFRMVHEEDRAAVQEQIESVLEAASDLQDPPRPKGHPLPPLEHRIVRKDGQVRWVRNTPILRRDTRGDLLSYDGLIQDITERVRAESLLQMLNAAALAISDGQSAAAITPEEIFAAVSSKLEKVGFACTIFAIPETQDKLICKFLSHDISDGTSAAAAEKLTGLKIKGLHIPIEGISDGTSATFVQPIEKKRALFIDSIEEVAPILGAKFPTLSPKIVGKALEALNLQRRTGTVRVINAPLIVEDKVIGMLVVQSDDLTEADVPAITAFANQVAAAWRKAELMQKLQTNLDELKRTQAQFLQAQKLESVGRLAGGIAHDFNNLLTVINGYSELLYSALGPAHPLIQNVEQIHQAGKRAAALTRRLLAFSRRQTMKPQVLDLNEVLEGMSKMLKRIIGEDINFQLKLDPGLGSTNADPSQIEQVIINLAVNAHDAMPTGGSLVLETANVRLDDASDVPVRVSNYLAQPDLKPGPYVMLTVSDTGCGMSPEVKKHLFEPFFTTKGPSEGTGLGLSTVYGIIKQSGGDIHVYSEPGSGTTFKIYFPRVKGRPSDGTSAASQSESPSPPLPRGTETILVVEDHDEVRKITVRMLRSLGYTVLDAAHGAKALELCRKRTRTGSPRPLDLILTDVVMPKMSGREFIEQLRQVRGNFRTLYMSGYSDDAIAQHSVLDPGTHCIQKPFSKAILAGKVRERLDAYDDI